MITDLTTTSRALIEQNPDLTNAQLGSWFSALASSAPTNASGVTYIEKVSAAQFYYFRVAIAADPTSASVGRRAVHASRRARPKPRTA